MSFTQISSLLKNGVGAEVDYTLGIKKRYTGLARNGNEYVTLTLTDGTKSIKMTLFNTSNTYEEFNTISGKAKIDSYNNTWQLKSIGKPEFSNVDTSDANKENTMKVISMIKSNLMSMIDSKILYNMVDDLIFNDPYFFKCAGAVGMHHACAGGLAQHSLEVASIAVSIAENLPGVNMSLIVAGALLHDIGKMDIYKFQDGNDYAILYDNVAGLTEHVVSGVKRINEWKYKHNLTEDQEKTFKLLEHIIISHHGQLEFGSPVPPKTMEAVIVSHADSISTVYNSLSTSNIVNGFSDTNIACANTRMMGLIRENTDEVVKNENPDTHVQNISENKVATWEDLPENVPFDEGYYESIEELSNVYQK